MSRKPKRSSAKRIKTGPRPSVSACLMVKNEADMLAQCLRSIESLADEIIIVDTGSTDGTVDIARRFDARVFNHPWEEDFSRHRNQTLSYATGDWLLVIDADEELEFTGVVYRGKDGKAESPAPAESVRKWLADLDEFNAAALDVIDVRGGVDGCSMNSPRLFRRGRVRYEGIVHNQPVIDGLAAVFCPLLRIRHYGYGLPAGRMRAKHERTVGLLKKQIESGGEAALQAPFYLAQQMGMVDRWAECARYCRDYLDNKSKLDGRFNGTVYYLGAHAAMYLGRREEALEWIVRGLAEYPDDADLCMTLADHGVWTKNWDQVAEGSRRHIRAAAAYHADPTSIGNRFIFKVRPDMLALSLHRLAMVRLRQGVNAWRELQNLMDGAGGIKNEMMAEAEKNFKEMGLAIDERAAVG